MTTKILGWWFIAAMGITLTSPGQAADMAARPAFKAPVAAEAWNPWMIRLRALAVLPRDSGQVDQVAGSNVNVSNTVVPELDITYFFSPNIAAELVLGVTRHHITGAGTLTGTDVGRVWLLPPTLTFQYHLTNFGAFKPYVGAGVNYTFFFSEKAAGGTITQMSVKDSVGFALQAGFDYMLDRHWGFNFDVKKLFLRPDVTFNNGALTGKVNLDPWLVAGGLTYKF